MGSEESDDQSSRPQSSAEWPSLSLTPSSFSRADKQSRPKVYSCNFCFLKFCSSQALGGHQNAHRKERRAARQHKMMTMPFPPYSNTAMVRSLGVQAHSLIHKDTWMMAARLSDANSRTGMAWDSGKVDEAAHAVWPGSFRFDVWEQEQHPRKISALDLNLKL